MQAFTCIIISRQCLASSLIASSIFDARDFASCSRRLPGASAANLPFVVGREKCLASAADAANLAINAGVFQVKAQQSISSKCGRRNIGHARLAVADWRGP